MTSHPTPPDDRPDTRTRILEVAEQLFRHYGFDKTTVADMARELGMSSANVYRFFASKLEIVQAIAERMFAARRLAYDAVVGGPGTPAERLRLLLVDDHRDSVANFVNDRKVHDIVDVAMQQQWPSIQAHLTRLADAIEQLVVEGNACGEFAVADTRAAAVAVRQCFASLLHPTLIVQCGNDPEQLGPEALADFIIGALRPRR